MSFLNLHHKTILVTGASSGIGAAIAIQLSKLGAQLILTGRDINKLNHVKSELSSGKHTVIQADLTNEEAIQELVSKVNSIDGLVHSAGIIKPFPVKYIQKQQINQMLDINYTAPVLLTSLLLKKKKVNDQASIVFMSSISSTFAHKGGALYSSSKAAIKAYSKTLAIEHSGKKIRSNVIEAAMVKTPLFDQAEAAVTKEMMDQHELQYPLGFGETADIANAVMFLLSDASKWITGTQLIMDGGLTAGQ